MNVMRTMDSLRSANQYLVRNCLYSKQKCNNSTKRVKRCGRNLRPPSLNAVG